MLRFYNIQLATVGAAYATTVVVSFTATVSPDITATVNIPNTAILRDADGRERDRSNANITIVPPATKTTTTTTAPTTTDPTTTTEPGTTEPENGTTTTQPPPTTTRPPGTTEPEQPTTQPPTTQPPPPTTVPWLRHPSFWDINEGEAPPHLLLERPPREIPLTGDDFTLTGLIVSAVGFVLSVFVLFFIVFGSRKKMKRIE